MIRTLALAGVGVLLALPTSRAAACGGCFAPTGQATVVTAHRMAISLSSVETILWDQFEYAGSPEDFVWVLPVAGDQDVQVQLAENAFFSGLTVETGIQLFGPSFGGGGCTFGCATDAADSSGPEERVTVFYEGTVGPYETVTIGSDDPAALHTWLNDRGYAIPDSLLPTLTHYVDLEMNFVALRLAPGESVTRMQPVRVVTPGLHVSFPLRMIAAGVSDRVSLELFVIAEGRYEAANFPNEVVDRSLVVYDLADDTFSYDALAEVTLRLNDGRTWLTEYSMPATGFVETYSLTDESGVIHEAGDDWRAATRYLDGPVITRMRADLALEDLGEDLVLAASAEGDLSGTVSVDRTTNSAARASVPGAAIVLVMAGALIAWGRRRRAG